MPDNNAMGDDAKSLETRFGLVMFGGVSLAIYINGVAQEFFNAVRGRGVFKLIKALTDSDVVVDIVSGTSAGGINGIMLAYALCNGREFSDSASLWRNDGDIRRLLRTPSERVEGGWSLLNSEGFYQPQLEAAFRDMRQISDSEKTKEDASPFDELDLFVTGTDVDGNRFTQFDDAGHAIEVKDHRSVFLLKHRRGRKEPFNPDFLTGAGRTANREVTYKSLAKLARITSCFPAAFSPVTVGEANAKGGTRVETPDDRLQLWGKLGKESCFLDGGLIDNKPFTYTLREIFFRGAVRRVDRKLFYVEPDPERWEKLDAATQPNFFQAIVASLIGIPGYESISEDLKLLASHNSKLERYLRAVSFLDGQGRIEPPTPQVGELYRRSRLISLSEWIVRGVLKIQGRFELLDKDRRDRAADLIMKFDKAIRSGDENGGDKEGDEEQLDQTRQQVLLEAAAEASLEHVVEGPAPVAQEVLAAGTAVPPALPGGNGAAKKNGHGDGGAPDYMRQHFPAYFKKLMDAVGAGSGEEEKLRITQEFFETCEGAKYAVEVSPEATRVLCDYDVDFRLRRVFRTIYFTAKQLGQMETAVLIRPEDWGEDLPGKHGALYEERKEEMTRALRYKQIWKAFNCQIELLDIIRSMMEKVIEDTEFQWPRMGEGNVWLAAENVLKRLLHTGTEAAQKLPDELPADAPHEWLVGDTLQAFCDALKKHAEDIVGSPGDAPPENFYSLLLKIETHEGEMVRSLLPDADDPVRRAYEDFVSLDAKLYPVELVAELNEKDIIKTYRISPYDARRGFSNKGLSDKVSGDALYHFGGFFKRSWRSNDILWGRLDGLCQLVETLFDADRIRGVMGNPFLREKVRARFFKEDGAMNQELSPGRLFRNAGKSVHDELEGWLRELLLKDYPGIEGGNAEFEKVLAKAPAICDSLIESAQFEVLVEDLPKVIDDSLSEQVTWNQFRIDKGKFFELAEGKRMVVRSRQPGVFRPPAGETDPFFGVVAAAGQTMKWLKRMLDEPEAARENDVKPTDTKLGRFFREDYKVGTEALLTDMPLLVLLEIVSVTLLVLRNCVLDIFDKAKADRVRSHPLYVAFIEAPLRTFNLLIRFLRRAPRWEKAVLVGAILASALTIFFTTWGRGEILFAKDGSFILYRFLLLIALPLLVIYSSYLYLCRESGKKKGASGSVLRLLASVGNALLWLTPVLVFGLFLLRLNAGNTTPVVLGERIDIILLAFASALAVVGPYMARFIMSERFKRRRLESFAEKLKVILNNYFSMDDIRGVARRLVASTPLEWEKVEKNLIEAARGNRELAEKVSELHGQLGGCKLVRWGDLKSRLEELHMSEQMRALAADYRIPLDDGWPSVGDHLPEGWVGSGALRFSVPTLKSWQREQAASAIADWAGDTGNLTRLVEHMRFVNPEALYGE